MIEETLSDLKKKISYLETQKIQTATKLKLLEEEKEKLLQECADLSVDPSRLEEQILEEEKIMQEQLAIFNEIINKKYHELQSFGH